MRTYVKSLSGFFFYLFGISFFTAYLLHFNQIGGGWPRAWMDIADLPFAFSAIVYGGASMYNSITTKDSLSVTALCFIGIPLIIFFWLLFTLNFWSLFF